MHWKDGSPPVIPEPDPEGLKRVADEYTRRQDWAAALSIGADLAPAQPLLAAELACAVMEGMQRHGGDRELLFTALPWLQAAEKHAHVTQVHCRNLRMVATCS